MTRSTIPTEYILIKAETNAEFVSCDFAIIHITEEWLIAMAQRLQSAIQFKGVSDFSRITFRNTSITFYECGENFSTDEILGKDEDWAYVELEDNETETLIECDNHLNSFLLHIDELGFAFYSANAEYTGEEYYTSDIPLNRLID